MNRSISIPKFVRLGAAAAVLALAGTMAGATGAAAAGFPDQAITIVVNWPAGGGQDTAARLIADYVAKNTSVPVVVSNVTGAGGAAGIRHVAEAAPDGYTIGIMGSSFVARQYINPNATRLDQVEPLVFFGPDPGALEVRADTGIKTVKDYIDRLKAKPGSITNGNDAPGGSSYIVAALIESKFGVKMTKVPYQGYAPTVAGLLAGEVQSATLPVHQFVDQYKAGTVNILGVASDERHFLVPDVPTFKEQGFDFVAGDWRALFLPKGVPADRVKALEELFYKTMSDPAFVEAGRKAGFVVTPMHAKETAARIVETDEAIYPVLLEAGLVKTNKKQ
ncbi:Tripartite-type tricarboxylate transporter, receptor component TctC [Tistlia consotensis]|uniref:Tripartite-type tricarboxylate transporter, receptor component TctC n=1 Tax=Tistlia consotensis USBA 355 TaxID=560819 RepID=A0A1Y6B8M1_9PROT|nr:tripartite tricarboxylate transporter substrate binding protein [Tistlia consotensis]SME90105.1 Tripartite-type tricarboxylate transporter, receptor component TctC [Tistlia consotensis USBA 355]SNR26554.1 Tripartite-type tricarboxylate transporter, receptor component TctC [Tistlia consotensis]